MPCNNNDKSNVKFCASAKIMCKFVRNRTYPYPAGGCNVENPRNEQTIWQWNENHYMKDALRTYLLKTRGDVLPGLVH